MDIHKNFSHAVVKTERGEVIKENARVKTDKESIEQFLEDIEEEFEVAVEATGNYEFFYETLKGLAAEVHLANPLKTRLIAEEKVKTDKVDANALADLLRGNLLPTSYIPRKEIRDLRRLARTRISLGKQRARIKNRIKGELRRKNIDYPKSNLFTDEKIRWLADLNNLVIDSNLSIYKEIQRQCDELEKRMQEKSSLYEEIRLLTTIPGVGVYTATVIFSEVADIDRFDSEEKLFSYAGLVPTVHQSGESTYHGRLIKQCSHHLKWVMVQAVQSHIRFCPESKITEFYRRLRKKKPNNVAKVAAARKLLQAIYWILKNKDEFRVQS